MDVLLRMPSCVEVIGGKAAVLAEDAMHVTYSLIKKGKRCNGSKNTCISNSRLRSSVQHTFLDKGFKCWCKRRK